MKQLELSIYHTQHRPNVFQSRQKQDQKLVSKCVQNSEENTVQ